MNQQDAHKVKAALVTNEGTLKKVAGLWTVYLNQAVTVKDVENMLGMVSMTRGVGLCPLEQLPEHPLVSEFWRIVNEVEKNGGNLNNSDNPNEIALRMPRIKKILLQAGWSDSQFRSAQKLLPLYSPYRLIQKNVAFYDKKAKATCKCWIFKKPQIE
jgi:hypothetical protein